MTVAPETYLAGDARHEKLKSAWHWLASTRNAQIKIGLCGILLIALAAVAAPLITSQSPTEITAANLVGPSHAHLLGTDQLGRDVFARVLYGARTDLQIGFVGVTIPLLIGTLIGLSAGYLGGIADAAVGRVIDIFVAFPSLVLVIAIVAMLGPGLRNFYIAITLVSWTAYARIIRAETLTLRGRGYVLAARSLGYSTPRIAFRHVLPNAIAPALVFAMSDFVLDILAGASLGFFGLGVPAPTPEWGVMIAEGRAFILTEPRLVLVPGICIILVGLFFSLVGEGLADVVRRVDG